MFENINERLQLHQRVKIIYMVTHIEARFYNQDGNTLVQVGKGETVEVALSSLNVRLAYLTDMDIKGDDYDN